jgi:hypothetical protein
VAGSDDFVRLSEQDREGWREQARALRHEASRLESREIPWIEGWYESHRLRAVFFLMPLMRQAKWPEGVDE